MRVEEGMQAETVQAISWQLQTELCPSPTQILLANKFLSQAGDIRGGRERKIRLIMRLERRQQAVEMIGCLL